MGADDRNALRPAVEAARAVLDDMDDDDVPARLQRVAKSSARRLPPPFERSLIDAMANDDEFRTKVAERWETSGDDDEIVAAFLDDPDSATALIAAQAEQAERDRARAATEDLQSRIERLERELAVARDRLGTARRDHADALRAQKDADKRARAALERSAKELRAAAAESAAAAEASAVRVASLEQQNADLAATVQRLGERRERRSSVEVRRQSPVLPSNNPRAVAAWLDTVERTLRPFRDRSIEASDDAARSDVQLPAGILPDSAEAVQALADLEVRRILVDGYNLAGAMGGEAFDSRTRDRVVEVVTGLRRHAGADVTVWFDAADVEGRRVFDTPGGVEVRFSSGQSADDAIVGDIDGEHGVVVVTNDRELRERCALLGALTLWSDALIAWLNA